MFSLTTLLFSKVKYGNFTDNHESIIKHFSDSQYQPRNQLIAIKTTGRVAILKIVETKTFPTAR